MLVPNYMFSFRNVFYTFQKGNQHFSILILSSANPLSFANPFSIVESKIFSFGGKEFIFGRQGFP